MTGKWQSFLDSLDTIGGHILLLLGVSGFLLFLTLHGIQSAEQMRGEFIGALLYSLRGTPRTPPVSK